MHSNSNDVSVGAYKIIYLIDYNIKNLQVSKIAGMGYAEASTFSGKNTGVQA